MKPAPLHIVYVRPDRDGIADYSRQVETIYHRLGYRPTVIEVGAEHPRELATRLGAMKPDVYHLEIGAGNGSLFELSLQLLKATTVPQLVTIHDPGVLVWSPFFVAGTTSASSVRRFVAKVYRRLRSQLGGAKRRSAYLKNPRITKLYLRPDYATRPRSCYLPQPTYHERVPPSAPKRQPTTVGYGGFWGREKGLETLLEAWEQLGGATKLSLTVAGSTADPADGYTRAINQRVAAMKQPVSLTGFAPKDKLDDSLRAMDVLVLPYWPELPNGTSAMAMRAAELAVPIIASDVPSLREQLGPDGAYYIRPKNPADLAAAIQEFARDPKPFRERAAATQRQMFATHSWDVVGQHLQTVLASLTQEARS